jgi:hypothetical protein
MSLPPVIRRCAAADGLAPLRQSKRLLTTVASVEIKKPAGKWEKVSGESYAKIQPDPVTGRPGGLGLGTIPSLILLMQDNKDRQMLARMSAPKN